MTIREFGSGTLSRRDKVSLLPHVALRLASTLTGVAAYRLGRRGSVLTPEPSLDPPQSAWAAEATSRGRAVLGDELYDHSLRTWSFGLALSRAEHVDLDPELFFVAAMLHDIGLRAPVAGRCFTYAGAQAAESTAPAHTPSDRVEQVMAAIIAHIEIREPVEPLGRYLQAGSLLDVAGGHIAEIDPTVLAEAGRHWSRNGFPDAFRSLWRQECRRFPRGRAAYARRPGGLLLGSHLNPLGG